VIYKVVLRIVQPLLEEYGFSLEHGRTAFVRQRECGVQDRILLLWDYLTTTAPVYCTANLTVCHPPWQAPPQPHAKRPAGARFVALTWNIGYLLPERSWHEWEFSADADPRPAAADMAQTIVRVGLPWLAEFDGAEAIRQALQASRPVGSRQLRRHDVLSETATPLHKALSRERRPTRSAVAVG
jgi:hypothetical protein